MKTLLQLLLPQPLQLPLQQSPLVVPIIIPIVQIGLKQATVLELTKLGWPKIALSLAILTSMKLIVHTGQDWDTVPKLMSPLWPHIARNLVIAKLEKKRTELIFETLTKRPFFNWFLKPLFNLDTCIAYQNFCVGPTYFAWNVHFSLLSYLNNMCRVSGAMRCSFS